MSAMPDTTYNDGAYNYAYLDEQTKRMIRRAILKAVAVPGYQVPFGGREMPLPYGWGTGGIQVTAAIIGQDDTLKVIDQGADDTTNAVSIRRFFAKVADVATTTSTEEATIIQTRHRVPETPLREGQILVFQVPIPEPLRMLEPRETETRIVDCHGLSVEDRGCLRVRVTTRLRRRRAHGVGRVGQSGRRRDRAAVRAVRGAGAQRACAVPVDLAAGLGCQPDLQTRAKRARRRAARRADGGGASAVPVAAALRGGVRRAGRRARGAPRRHGRGREHVSVPR